MMTNTKDHYYIPHGSHWPIMASIGLFITLIGAGNWVHSNPQWPYLISTGAFIIVVVMFGWFHEVIRESRSGLYNAQVDSSFRWGMTWFIFSEICFFGAFFGALFYSRFWTIPMLGGDIHPISHLLLWPDFSAQWPLLLNPDNLQFIGPEDVIPVWAAPALNTLILLTSGVTITWAHWALKLNKRVQLIIGMLLTVALGLAFLTLQATEYHEAYTEFGLTLESGIYGTTFFVLTGFHGAHVTIGTIMLIVILLRCIKGHFSPHHHFGFEAVAWYWHFVDVVWLFLFIFVYWL